MADLEIVLSQDGLKATVASIAPGTTAEEILAALAEAGVTEGRQTTAIIEAVGLVQKTRKPVLDVVVAEGGPAHFKVPPQLIHKSRGEEEKLPSLAAFKQLLSAERPEEVLKAAKGTSALAVGAGEVLATKVEGEIEPGKSVKGESVTTISEDQMSPQFIPGPGVQVEGGEFRAKFPGYAGILEGQVAVLPPVWISPDGMVAAYINLAKAQGSADFALEDITTSLSAAGIKVGVVDERLAVLAAGLADGSLKKVLIPIAAGKFSRQPVDGQVEFSIASESQSGAVSKDGSIDLRERSGFPSVTEDQLLAESIPPVQGVPGATVTGREIDVDAFVQIELIAGDNVRLEEQGEVQKLYSSINGGVSVEKTDKTADEGMIVQYTLSARDCAQVAGNVDYDTGNINYNGNVEIKGTVLSGFSVTASGDVAVLESVEDAAVIEAGGTVTVKQGIVGDKTRITAKGGVQAKFIQDATIVAGGDVVVDSYIRTANVQTETEVNVKGGATSGGIIGGETWALKSIVSKNIGAEGTASTLVCAGVLPSLFEEFKKKRDEANKAQQSKTALMAALKLTTLDMETVANLVARYPKKKDEILKVLKMATEADATEQACRSEMAALIEKMDAKGACLDVSGTAFHKVRVRIGESESLLTENLAGVRFRLSREDKGVGIESVPLAEADKE